MEENAKRLALSKRPQVALFFRPVSRDRYFSKTHESANAAVKVVSRLRRANYVEKHSLYGKRRYYKTGYRATQLGLPWTKEPFGTIALPRLYAAMVYLNRGTLTRRKLEREELQRLFPEMPIHGEATYFREHQQLGAVLTDLGGTEFHLANRLHSFYDQRFPVPAFRQLLEHDHFHLVVVVPTPERALALQRCLQRNPVPLRIVLAQMPELTQLTTRFDHATT